MQKILILEDTVAAGVHAAAGTILLVPPAEAALLIGVHRATGHLGRIAAREDLLAGQAARAREISAALSAPAPTVETAAAPPAVETAAPARPARPRSRS